MRYFICSVATISGSLPFVALRGMAQLVARPLWEREAVGSSPATPTKRISDVYVREVR